MKALVYGHGGELMEAIPPLLHRAGFAVDVIAVHEDVKRSKHANHIVIVKSVDDLIEALAHKSMADYQLYVPTDDLILNEVNSSNIPDERKMALLQFSWVKFEGIITEKVNWR